jgi:hypothetical protein
LKINKYKNRKKKLKEGRKKEGKTKIKKRIKCLMATSLIRFPSRTRDFSPLHSVQTCCEAQHTSFSKTFQGFFLRG